MIAVTAAAISAVAVMIAAEGVRAIRGAENGPEAAAGFRLSRRGEHIQREADGFKVCTGVCCCGEGGAAFGHTSAQRVDYHIDCAEQFYNGKQSDRNIDSNRCTQCHITAAAAAVAITATGIAGTAGRIPQLCLQSDGFAFGNHKRSAAGVTTAVVQIGYGRDICFGGAKQRHPQIIHICGIDCTDETAVCTAEFQYIFKYIFQFQIPAAFLQRVRAFPQDFDAAQFQIPNGYISGVTGGNNNIALAQHIVAIGHSASCGTGRTQNVACQAFLDAALVEDFLCDDAGFSAAVIAVAACIAQTVSCT